MTGEFDAAADNLLTATGDRLEPSPAVLQGAATCAQCARRAQASHCGEILRDLFAREGRDPAAFDYVSSPLAVPA